MHSGICRKGGIWEGDAIRKEDHEDLFNTWLRGQTKHNLVDENRDVTTRTTTFSLFSELLLLIPFSSPVPLEYYDVPAHRPWSPYDWLALVELTWTSANLSVRKFICISDKTKRIVGGRSFWPPPHLPSRQEREVFRSSLCIALVCLMRLLQICTFTQ